MLEKVRSSSRNAEFGALPLLIDDCERILLELRNLVDLCMEYRKFIQMNVSFAIIGKCTNNFESLQDILLPLSIAPDVNEHPIFVCSARQAAHDGRQKGAAGQRGVPHI